MILFVILVWIWFVQSKQVEFRASNLKRHGFGVSDPNMCLLMYTHAYEINCNCFPMGKAVKAHSNFLNLKGGVIVLFVRVS